MDTPPPTLAPDTRDRLLRAAGAVFSEQGFRRATVREICSRAGANVAAVNYHFGDKEGLYAEVLGGALGLALQKYPPDMDLPRDVAVPVEQRLHAFVRSFLYRVLDDGPHAWHGRLMLWEMVEPTAALDGLLKDTIRPLYERLTGIVAELLGPAATPERVRMGCASVLGQCTFYRTAGTLLARVQPEATTFDGARIEALAAHVTRMTVAGLRGYASEGGAGV